jgi:hypothetical protein
MDSELPPLVLIFHKSTAEVHTKNKNYYPNSAAIQSQISKSILTESLGLAIPASPSTNAS